MNTSLNARTFASEFRAAIVNPYFSLAFSYFFCLLFAYYLLRPVREEMGILAGVDNLQWLYSGTFVAMVSIIPLFGYLKNLLSRHFLVVGVYVFFAANLLLFHQLFGADPVSPWTARAFFVWLSVFNMFAVSVFWSLMADVLSPGQVKVMFAPISAGGSLGGIVGSLVTASFVSTVGLRGLLLLAAVLLIGVAVFAGLILRRSAKSHGDDEQLHMRRQSSAPTGGVLAGVTEVAKSGYLARITALSFIYTAIASLLYFVQANLVSELIADSEARTQFFALINFGINAIALVLQFFITSLLVRHMGVGKTYGLMVALILVGVITLGIWPAIASLALAQVMFRSGQFGTMKPCYDMLFSIVTEEQKYKSKNFIDTSVVRAGDLFGGWFFTLLKVVGLSLSAITAIAAVGLVALGYLGVQLGGRFDRQSVKRTL